MLTFYLLILISTTSNTYTISKLCPFLTGVSPENAIFKMTYYNVPIRTLYSTQLNSTQL